MTLVAPQLSSVADSKVGIVSAVLSSGLVTLLSHQSKTTTRQRQDNDKTNVEPVHSYDAFHTRHVKGIIGMHRFNICVFFFFFFFIKHLFTGLSCRCLVVLLWCENTIKA